VLLLYIIFEKTIHGKLSPNRRKYAQSGHPERTQTVADFLGQKKGETLPIFTACKNMTDFIFIESLWRLLLSC
jgi:hypothetical protein